MDRPGSQPAQSSGVSPVARWVLVALAALATLLTGGLEVGARLPGGSAALVVHAGTATSSREVQPAPRRDHRLRLSAVPAFAAAPSAPQSSGDGPAGPAPGAALPAPLQTLGEPAPRPATSAAGAAVKGPGERAPPVTTGT